jgi:hypothetical protein
MMRVPKPEIRIVAKDTHSPNGSGLTKRQHGLARAPAIGCHHSDKAGFEMQTRPQLIAGVRKTISDRTGNVGGENGGRRRVVIRISGSAVAAER